jgi:hypothetical protein
MKKFLFLLIFCFATINIHAQILNGLVAHYPFSGDATDAIGTVDGTISNAALTSDRFGTANSAYSFTTTGSNRSFIDFDNNFNGILGGSNTQFSISMWFKVTNVGQKIILFSKHSNTVYCNSDDAQLLVLLNTTGTLQLNYYENTTATNYAVTTNLISDTSWHHLVVTYDGNIGVGQNRVNFYVDNTIWSSTLSNNGTDVNAISANNAHTSVGHVLSATGAACNSNAHGSNGSIDDIRLYNRIVSICDVGDLFGEGDSSDGLVAHYPFSGNATDAVGTVDGTISNASLISDRFGAANSAYSFTTTGSNRSFIDFGNNFNGILGGSNTQFSISTWFKVTNVGQKMILFSKHSNTVYCNSNDAQLLVLLNTTGTLQLNYYENTTATNYAITTNLISDSSWHHLVVTYNGNIGVGQNRVQFYVDNSEWGSTLSNNGANVNAISANNAHASIGHVLSATGAACNSNAHGSNGSIDDIYLYSKVLTPCDVDSLYTPTTNVSINNINDVEVSLKLYPNPVDDVLHLNIESTVSFNKELTVQIINLTGQVLKSQVLESDEMTIGTSQLATGVYFVRVLDGIETIAIQKMIKY